MAAQKLNKIDKIVNGYKNQLKSYYNDVRAELEIQKYKNGLSLIDYPMLRQSINDHTNNLISDLSYNFDINENAKEYISLKLQDYSCELHN